jgi:predicted Zn-dependent protease
MSNENLFILGLVLFVAIFVIASRRKERPDMGDHGGPLAEAELLMAYGKHRKAIKILEKHIAANPDDAEAMKLLNRIRSSVELS